MLRSLLLNGTFFSPMRAAESEDGNATVAPPKPLGVSSVEEIPATETETVAAKETDPEAIEGAEPPAGTTEAEREDWRDKEIRKKHAQLQDAKRKIADLEAIAQRVKPEGGPDKPTGETRTAEIDPALVRAEAAKMKAADDYTAGCNAADANGKKNYGDKWGKAIDTLTQIGGMTVDDMAGVLATDDPARVLYELGNNPDEYHRIMELPPARRLAEMVKIAIKPAPKKKVSEAPPPVDQVQGTGGPRGGSVNLYDDKIDDDSWYAVRKAQKDKRWREKNGRAA